MYPVAPATATETSPGSLVLKLAPWASDAARRTASAPRRARSDEASRRLHIAIKLVEAGADPDNRQHGCGGTPLHHTLAGGYIELVKFLLKEKADVNASNRYGARASIHHAHTHARTPSFSHPSFLFPRSPQACTRSTLQ